MITGNVSNVVDAAWSLLRVLVCLHGCRSGRCRPERLWRVRVGGAGAAVNVASGRSRVSPLAFKAATRQILLVRVPEFATRSGSLSGHWMPV